MSEALIVRGEIVDPHDDEITALENEVKRLRRELAIANGEIAKAKGESSRALSALRKQLAPLYRALQAVFCELDAAGMDDAPPTHNDTPRTIAIWENWKQKIRGQAAQIIDALLLHHEMTAQQIAIAIGIHRKNVPQLIFKLNKAGLIYKNGDRYSLKQL